MFVVFIIYAIAYFKICTDFSHYKYSSVPNLFLLTILNFALQEDNAAKLTSAPNFSHCLPTMLNALCGRDKRERERRICA